MPRTLSALATALLLSAARGSSPAWSEASPFEGGAHVPEERPLAGVLERRRSELQDLVLLATSRGLPLSAVEAHGLGGRARAPPEGEAVLERALEGAGAAHAATHEHGHLDGGHEHEREGEEKEPEFEPWDTDTSIMLLGMILSVMMLFYLTNWPDDDIRLYSWQITSSTISIFCSIMLFTGFNSLLRVAFETKDNLLTMVGLHFLHCFLYLAIMHVGCAVESGVMCDTAEKEEMLPEYKWVYVDGMQCTNGELVPEDMLCNIRGNKSLHSGSKKGVLELKEVWMQDVMEIPVEKKQHEFLRRKRRTKALSMLTGHMAGFAAIASGISLQRCSYQYLSEEFDIDGQWSLTVEKTVLWVSLILNQLVLRMAFKVSEIARDIIHWKHYIRIKNEGSGSTTHARHGYQMKEELMMDENIEAENDVSSLSMSYLAVNILRFGLTGYLADEQAKEPEHWRPELYRHVLPLYGIGLLTVAVASCQAIAMVKFKWPDPQANATIFRVAHTTLHATAMCFAWCVLVATDWAIEWFSHANELTLHRIFKAVVVAGVLNAIVCGALFVMDKVHDRIKVASMNTRSGRQKVAIVSNIVRINVTALGILVGFSWEHCFDGGVETISHRGAPQTRLFIEISLGIMVCIVILPAWRRYILQRVMQIEELQREEDEVPFQEQSSDAGTASTVLRQENPGAGPELFQVSSDRAESRPLLSGPAGRQREVWSPGASSSNSAAAQESPGAGTELSQVSSDRAESRPLLSGPAGRQREVRSSGALAPRPLVPSPKPQAAVPSPPEEAAQPGAVEAGAPASGPAARTPAPRGGSRNKIKYRVPREPTPAASDGF